MMSAGTLSHDAMVKIGLMIWHMANVMFKEYNPCKFDKKGWCIYVRRVVNKHDDGGYRKNEYKSWCCHSGDCRHLKNDRCNIKTLMCKLYVCNYLYEIDEPFAMRISVLKDVAYKMGLYATFDAYEPIE